MKKILFLFLFTVIFVLGACGGDESNGGDGSSDDDNESGQTGGTLEFAFNAQPPTLDPLSTTATATRDISRHVFEQLVSLDENLEVQPMLASEVEMDDGSIIFHLREDVLFHNGEEMNADDVIASMERWLAMSSQAQTFMESATFNKVDDYTVEAISGNGGLLDMYIFADLTQIAAIMPAEIATSSEGSELEEFVGTGPYMLDEWVSDQYISLIKFDEYSSSEEPSSGLVGEKNAYFDQILFNIVTDPATRVSGVQTGQYDISNFIPFDNAETLEGDEGVALSSNETSIPGLVFNKREGIMSDQLMRQAVNAALNIDDMMLAAYTSEEYYSMSHELMNESQEDWYTDVGGDRYNQQDLELAEQLMNEAGYEGEPIRIIASREYDDYYSLAVSAQQQLESAGMNVSLEIYDWATLLEMRDDPSAYEIFTTGWGMRPTPVQYPFLDSRAEWAGWSDSEEIDALIDEINAATDSDEILSLSEQLQDEFWEYLPIIKPGNSYEITAYNTDIEGFDYLLGPILWNAQRAE